MDSQSKRQRQSLITASSRGSQQPIRKKKIGLDVLLVFGGIAITLVLIGIALIIHSNGQLSVQPESVSIPWFSQKSVLIMQVGTSRIFEPHLYSGKDNRAYNNFKQVTQRSTTWSVQPAGIITVDMYGRLNAIKQGTCKLKLQSNANNDAFDQLQIKVVKKRIDVDNVPKRVIKFNGQAANTVSNLQKIVERYTVVQIVELKDAPQSVKYAVKHTTQIYPRTVTDGNLIWSIKQYANGNPNQFVHLLNITKQTNDKDRQHYFIGDRYLPDQGNFVIMIETDNKGGIWIVGSSGNTTHIKMVEMSYSEKAEYLNKQTQTYVLRHGMASGAYKSGDKWIQQVADNDGLWTSMYGAGQLMKYSVLKQRKSTQTVINKARQSALRSLKAVLFIANAAGRQGKVQSKIRYLNNSRLNYGKHYSKQYLIKDKQNLRDTYVGSPVDGTAFYGNVADKTIDNDTFTGRYKYSMLPINKDDWTTNGTPATMQKNLQGFMSRTFVIPASGLPAVPSGGLFFQRNNNNTHTVLSGASQLYDFTDNDHPTLQLGNKPIPQILKSVLNINGKQYSQSDIVYKGQTSTDQVIGHLFIYKIAYDILDDTDNQQKQLKQLIRQTMNNFCQHLVNNGYTMVDATGISTTWTKLLKQFLGSDFTIQDGTLKAIQLLLSFKVAYYVTGERKWKEQYDLLTKDEKYMYGKFVGMMWDRWVWAFTKSDDSSIGLLQLDYTLNPSQIEIQRHVLYQTHFSDQQQAYLAFYLALQLEDDQQLLEHYRKGMNGYWHSISKSQNPLWYYIYQLGYPNATINDSYGQDLRQVASWQLSRHMLDATQYQAHVKGARSDVIYEGPISVNPNKILGKRTSESDKKYVNDSQNAKISSNFDPTNIYEVKVLPADERSIHKFNGATFQNIYSSHNPNSIQPSTTYTLPYWLGVYHGLIKFD